MRDLKRPNSLLPAYKELGEKGIEIFTPMQWHVTLCQGKRMRQQRPFIPDLLFAHASRAMLDPLVEAIPTLQYRYLRGGAYCEGMIVPDNEMNRFIRAVTGTPTPHYLLPSELTPASIGAEVTIIGGPMDGYTGRLLKIRGARSPQLLSRFPTCWLPPSRSAPNTSGSFNRCNPLINTLWIQPRHSTCVRPLRSLWV